VGRGRRFSWSTASRKARTAASATSPKSSCPTAIESSSRLGSGTWGSAGSTSALHLCVRHPARVRALVLVSANVPGPHQSKGMPPRPLFKAIFGSDPILWAMITYLPGVMGRLSQVLVVPEGVQLVPGAEEKFSRAMRQVLLGKRRVTGEVFDAYVSNPDVNRIELSHIQVPTLVMHARDDPGPPYARAVEMAHRIPDAQLVTVKSGGHLMLGDHADAIGQLARFIHEHSPSRAKGSQGDQGAGR
jgi:pimeloyl-ACP methyl ester carboxylesterase